MAKWQFKKTSKIQSEMRTLLGLAWGGRRIINVSKIKDSVMELINALWP